MDTSESLYSNTCGYSTLCKAAVKATRLPSTSTAETIIPLALTIAAPGVILPAASAVLILLTFLPSLICQYIAPSEKASHNKNICLGRYLSTIPGKGSSRVSPPQISHNEVPCHKTAHPLPAIQQQITIANGLLFTIF